MGAEHHGCDDGRHSERQDRKPHSSILPREAVIGILYDSHFRAEGDDGTLLDNATLRFYETGTTTLASIFTSDTLLTPLGNPVPASAGGVFPQVFAPLGQVFDIALLDENGVKVREWLSTDSIGTDSGDFVRDFAGSRVSIGSGDIGDGTIGTNLEFGDPSPDDIGGTARIGGWASTRGDRLDLDFTTVNANNDLNVLGHLEEKGKPISEVLEATYTVAATASFVIALPDLPANVREWEIDMIDLYGQSSATYLEAVFSYDGGVTFKTGTSDYSFSELITTTAGGGGNQAANLGYIRVTEISPQITVGSWMKIRIITPISTSLPSAGMPTLLAAESSYYLPGTPAWNGIKTIGYGLGSYGRATHVKFVAAVGTFSCIARVRPQRGFGE